MPQNIPESADVVVIGGGIIGVSTAYYLARQGVKVVLCEKAEIACEQSSRNWGFIRKQGRHPLEIPLMVHALECWHDIVPQLDTDIGFHVGGTIYLSETEQRYQANLAWLEHAKNFQLDSTFLSPSELKALIPGMADQTRGALYTPSDARAEPDIATSAIATKASSLGATILTQCAVRGIDIEAGKVAGVMTEHGRIRASSVVCATGAWSGYFCRNFDLVFPHLKVTASVMATKPIEPIAQQSSQEPIQQSIWRSGLGLRRRLDGGYTVAYGGGSICDVTTDLFKFFMDFFPAYRHSKEVVYLKFGKRFFHELKRPSKWSLDDITPFETERVLDPDPNLKFLAKAYQHMEHTFPQLKGVGISKRWAGMIDVTPDELPIISEVDEIPGLVISTGYSGHGFGIGLGAGKVTSELVRQSQPHVDLSGFSLNRFS